MGVVEDDEGRVSRQARGRPSSPWPRHCAIRKLADFRGAGEREFPGPRGFCVSSRPTSGRAIACHDIEDTLSARQLARRAQPARSAESGVSSDGLITTVQPAAIAGATLRVIMAMGKIPRRDGGDNADRLLQHHQAPSSQRRGYHNRHRRAFASSANHSMNDCAVGDFAARLCQRLSLLGCHEARKVFLVDRQKVEPFAQNLCALLCGSCLAMRARLFAAASMAPRVSAASKSATSARVFARRWVHDGQRRAPRSRRRATRHRRRRSGF